MSNVDNLNKMALIKIPDKDQNLLSASFYINSYKRVIEELVYNSLDAESTSIAIRICVEKKYIQVLDNGTGVTKDNFRLLGEKYFTSKFIDATSLKSRSNKYGFKGTSLASTIEVSENVKISSKFQNSQETWIKTFSRGSTEGFYLTTLRPSKGTTVEVSGFLYNLNVQRKSIDALHEINNIKLTLEQLSLVHCNVSFSLRDDSKNEIIFKIHKNRNIYQTLWSIFKISTSDVQDLQVEKNEYKIKAYIGKNCSTSKNYQWIYLNGRILSKSFLHKKVNETLTKKLSIKTTKKLKEKFTDENDFNCKIPFYFIFISCPNFDFNVNYNNKQTFVELKNCNEVNKLIEKLVNFYCGEISLKPIKVREGINNNINNDTRKKVKEIMENILKKNDVKPFLTHPPNGRKGKNIIRKLKKKQNINNTLKKTENYSKTKLAVNIIRNNNNYDSKILSNILNNNKLEIIHSNIHKNRNVIRTNKNIKNVKATRKQGADHGSLIEKFRKQTESVKKRCRKLSYEVQRLISKKYFYREINETDEMKAINLESIDRIDCNKETNEFVLQNYKTTNYELIKNHNNPKRNQVKTSYDLLKTADDKVMSQMTIFSEDKIKDNDQLYENVIPNLTFNSHKRAVAFNKRIIQHFSNKNSCNNLNKSKLFYRNFYKKKNRNNIKSNNNHFLKALFSQNYKNNSMTINISDDSSKKIINKDNVICDSYNYNLTDNLNNNIMSTYNINFNLASTYTIDVVNSVHSTNDEICKTYSIRMSTNLSHNGHITKTSPAINDTIKSKDNHENVFIPESSSDKIIDPLVYCEAILNSSELRDFEQEFNISFLDKEKRDTALKINDNSSPDSELKRKIQCLFIEKNDGILEDNNRNEQVILKTTQDEILKIEPLQVFNSENHSNNFELKNRLNFVPKGMSQIFRNDLHKKNSHNINDEYYKNAIYKNFSDDVRNKFEIFEPGIKNVKDAVTRHLNKVNYKIKNDNSDLKFNTESLKNAKVLGQIDRKFIAARILSKCSQAGRSSQFLTLFDQHAVDERISLERNLSDYFDGVKWKSVLLEPFKLKLSEEDYFYLYNYKEKFSPFGLEWTFTNNDVIINAVPKAVLGKHPRKAEVIFAAVKRFISEQVEVLKLMKGNLSLYPKSIMELVFSEACRYAIKFGDRLSYKDCLNMISTLATCKAPFQCAHGRPAMAVITELSNNNRTYKINLNNIKNFKQNMLKESKL